MSNRRSQPGVQAAVPQATVPSGNQAHHPNNQMRNVHYFNAVSASNNPMYTTPQQFNTNTPPPVQGSQPPPAINAAQRTPFYHGQHHQRMPQSAHMMRPNRGGNGNHPHQQGVPPQQQQYHMPIPQLQYGAPVIVMQPQQRFPTVSSGNQTYPYPPTHIQPGTGAPLVFSQYSPYQAYPNQFHMPPPMPGITNQPMTIGGQGQPPAVVPQPGQTAGQQGQQQPPPQQQPRPQPTPTPPYQGGTYGNPQPLVQGQFTQSAAPAGPQAAPKKRPKNILVITDPDTGANVLDGLLKGKDEGKAAETATKKDESKAVADSTKEDPAAINVKDEFQSKVSKMAAESKVESEKMHPENSLSNNTHSSKEEDVSQTPVQESKEPATTSSKPDDAPKVLAAPSKKTKKADLNRKGAEKAGGSDMDLFLTPETSDVKKTEEKKEEPSESVLSSSTSSLTSTETLPVVAKAEEVVHNNNNEVKEEPVEPRTPSTPATVPENNGETETATNSNPVENGTSTATTGSQVKLKYTYPEGQWSPNNPDGKKQYDRDFLYQLMHDPKSLTKPSNLPHVDIIKDKAMPATKMSSAPGIKADFMPNFVKTLPRGPGGGGSLTKSRSKDGKRLPGGPNAGNKPMVLNIQEKNIKLRKAENAWKPDKLKSNEVQSSQPETDPMAEVSKQVLSILNKLTPQMFDRLIQQFKAITIDTEAKLKRCIELIFEKAVDEPGFSEEYAKMCSVLNTKDVQEDGVVVNFRKLLIGRCQIEFEKDYMEGLNKEEYEEQLAKAETEEAKREIKENFEERERKARRRSSGNTRFIGELYKLKMLTVRIMHECIRGLLNKAPEEESLECLCRLVTTVGKVLEEDTNSKIQGQKSQGEVVHLDYYFNQMQRIIDERQTSMRVRCLLLDLIDLRTRKWVPRRTVAGPKTLDQIHKDVEREKKSQQLENLAYSGGGSSKSLGGRDAYSGRSQDGRKRSSRVNEDGWSTAVKKPSEKIDAKMFTDPLMKKDPISQMFRPSFNSWGKGSGAKPSKEAGPSVMHSNRFNLLNQQNERSSSPSSDRPRMASRSVGGAMSTTNERHAALQAVKDMGMGKLSVPNGPSSARHHLPALYAGPSEEEIASYQEDKLKGDAFSGDDEETKEKLERRLKSIIDEQCLSPHDQNAVAEVIDSCKPNNMAFAVETWTNRVFESKDIKSREKLGYLIVSLINARLIQRAQVVQGLGNILEIAEHLICDIPKFWEWIGELIAPLLEKRLLTMNMLAETAARINEGEPCKPSGLYVEAVLRMLEAKVGQQKVVAMWNEAKMDWATFLPESSIKDFVSKHHLEFTQPSVPDPTKLDGDQLKEAMAKLMNSAVHPYAEVFEFVDAYLSKNCKGGEPDNAFIRSLTTAVTRSCLDIKQDNQDPSQQSIQCRFQPDEFEKRARILKRILEGNTHREKQALYAMQALMSELEYPSRMLQEIFEALNNNDLISQEAFEQWEKCNDPAEFEGKGVAIKSTIQFFTMLHEDDDDDDDDAEDD